MGNMFRSMGKAHVKGFVQNLYKHYQLYNDRMCNKWMIIQNDPKHIVLHTTFILITRMNCIREK